MPPIGSPPGPPGAAASGSGMSAIATSVVSSIAAIDTESWRANLITLVGSNIPESFKTLENLEEKNCKSNYLQISNNNQVFNTKKDSNQINQYIKTPKLPLPNIKNLRKWINKDKKAS